MAAFELVDVKRGLAVKRGAAGVPDDGRYHVIVDGEIILSTRVESAALIEYEEQRDRRMATARARLAAESADRDARQFKNDVLSGKANRAVKQGAPPKH